MLFFVGGPMLDDVDAWNPFKPKPQSPFQYPLNFEPGFERNSFAPGNMWLPDPHPYADGEPWPEYIPK